MKLNNKVRPSVIGLGKLGLPLAAVISSSGYKTIGIDKSKELIDALNSNTFYTPEPLLMDTLDEFRNQLVFTSEYTDLVSSNISFVIVPTPSQSDMRFDNSYSLSAINSLLEVWVESEEEKTIVIVSTVMPGTCKEIFEPLINNWIQDNNFAHKINLLYCPEFIALGTVIFNLRYPDMTLVGCNKPTDAKIFLEIMDRIVKNDPEVSILNLREAEIVKIMVNCFVTMKISFANFIGEISSKFLDVDKNKVAKALSLDSRIGSKYLRPGLGFAGPCFPRDNKALIAFSSELDIIPELAIATDRINDRLPNSIVEDILLKYPHANYFGVVGLAYKAKTNITEASQTVKIANILINRGKKVLAYDKLEFDRSILEKTINTTKQTSDFNLCDVIIVAKEHELEINSLKDVSKEVIIL